MASVFYREPLSATVGKRMIATGPDYIKDHLPKIHQHTSYIGEKRPVLEKTGDLQYLWRPASNLSFPAKYKHEYVGGVGWGVQEYNFINKSRLESGFHIKYGDSSIAALDKITHRYQNPWQPAPSVLDKQGKYSRGFLAWHLSDYEDTDQRKSQGAALVRQRKSPARVSGAAKPPKAPQKEEVGSPITLHNQKKNDLVKQAKRLERVNKDEGCRAGGRNASRGSGWRAERRRCRCLREQKRERFYDACLFGVLELPLKRVTSTSKKTCRSPTRTTVPFKTQTVLSGRRSSRDELRLNGDTADAFRSFNFGVGPPRGRLLRAPKARMKHSYCFTPHTGGCCDCGVAGLRCYTEYTAPVVRPRPAPGSV
ncbi:uncharacterized protein C4orf45 homolog [Ochotona curzoniae]|uniref:uncharacterized protein C4orf45 homolog n=1 Tax=Ochotona curzoniae TaxID=130825 RepID=UPI001B34D85E|nr:uncharacterized protein C4orf45 homolog [Ochotona curzoniae]